MSKNGKRSSRKIADKLTEYINRPLAILCARYWYRGIVDEVGDDFLVLRDPRVVEVSGPATAEATVNEDVVPSEMLISFWAIEMISRPGWVAHGLTDGVEIKREAE